MRKLNKPIHEKPVRADACRSYSGQADPEKGMQDAARWPAPAGLLTQNHPILEYRDFRCPENGTFRCADSGEGIKMARKSPV
ncbi:hypothetical protein GCM10010468_75400 [Actinocorallia longicatena]|uniref:Uncharacterized protein n=1 Tax=Actinocorallia longicatena TaxID=111803 RepID=A0ABP6QL26_9ACTN